MKQLIALESIIIDKEIQPRVKGLDEQHVLDLIDAYDQPDADIPPLKVWTVQGKIFLSQGFHRFEALKRKGRKKVECEIKFGTMTECKMDAAGSNSGHGLKRTNADKKRAVSIALECNPDWSDRKIADAICVSPNFVSELREQLSSDDSSKITERVGIDGKTRKVPQPKPKKAKGKTDSSNSFLMPDVSDIPDDQLKDVPQNIPAEPVGKLETYYRNDGIPDLPGVYRPKMMKSSGGTEVVLDGYNNPTPSAVGDTFSDPTIRDILAQAISGAEVLDSVYSQFIELKAGRKPFHQFPWLDIPTIQKLASTMRETAVKICDELRAGIPYAVCPACAGERKGCKECRLSGYWPKSECEAYPERFRTGAA